jgi:hypothetical protein
MKATLILLSSFVLLHSTRAATIRVEGFLEGSAQSLEFRGDTMDYYKFAVLTPGRVRIDQRRFGIARLAEFIGREDQFGFLTVPNLLTVPDRCDPSGCPPIFLERDFEAGEYVLILTASLTGSNSSYDVFDGYVPVNREGGGFSQFAYQYDITGPVVGLEYWDGHLDGTFTVTQIPEPSTSALGLCALLLGLLRRKR